MVDSAYKQSQPTRGPVVVALRRNDMITKMSVKVTR